MYFIYILKQKNNRLYYGYTSNIEARLSEHLNNGVKTTKNQEPELIYYEAYKSQKDAMKRERFIKTGQGRELMKKQIENSLISEKEKLTAR